MKIIICHKNNINSKKLKKENEDIGHIIYEDKQGFLYVLIGPSGNYPWSVNYDK